MRFGKIVMIAIPLIFILLFGANQIDRNAAPQPFPATALDESGSPENIRTTDNLYLIHPLRLHFHFRNQSGRSPASNQDLDSLIVFKGPKFRLTEMDLIY